MTKPQHKNPPTTFYPRGLPLTQDVRAELCAILEISQESPAAVTAISSIETALGAHPGLVSALDNEPRAANYREAFRPIHDKASSLLEMLKALGDRYKEQFIVEDVELRDIQDSLGEVIKVSESVLRRAEGESSTGRQNNAALAVTIQRLRAVFMATYKGPRDARKKQGAFTSLSEAENRELDFVKTALRYASNTLRNYEERPEWRQLAAGLHVGNDDDSLDKLKRLFRDSRTDP